MFLNSGIPSAGDWPEWELVSHREEHSNLVNRQNRSDLHRPSVLPRYAPSLRCFISTSSGLLEVSAKEKLGLAAHGDRLEAWRWQLRVYGTNLAHKRQGAPVVGGGGRMQGEVDKIRAGPPQELSRSCAQTTGHCMWSAWRSGAATTILAPEAGGPPLAAEKGEQALFTALSGMGPGNTHELHTLRKEASIQTKNPSTKILKPTQTTQGCSCTNSS